MSRKRCFNSKVLLFGEYSVIKDSMALSSPYQLFEGHLNFKRQGEKSRDPELKALSSYLKRLESKGELHFDFDVSSFEFDVGQGLYFDSTIPQGYGVGSSGALCAALYDRYACAAEENDKNIVELKKDFALMESHFHGSSSGMDPLISYLNQSILVGPEKSIGKVKIPKFDKKGEGAVFLLNTGRSRKTEPLVNLFLEKCKTPEFNEACVNRLLPITNNCINHFLEGDIEDLQKSFRELSEFQFEYFNPMIPKLFQDVWSQGLSSGKYLLKLCGAGGGGFLLGLTHNFKESAKELEDYEVRPLVKF